MPATGSERTEYLDSIFTNVSMAPHVNSFHHLSASPVLGADNSPVLPVVIERSESLCQDEEQPGTKKPHDGAYEVEHIHLSHRAPWLRAALLGANDGLVSVASIMVGVGAVQENNHAMLISGIAGLVAGALSMAIGEYISVHGQRDIEEADLQKEREEFLKGPEAVARELEELTQIYVGRGLSYKLAKQVAEELSKDDPIKAHARDELGIDLDDLSNPLQAAGASAIAFISGALIPLLSAGFIQHYVARISVLVGTTTMAFVGFGMMGAWLGGAPMLRAAVRSTLGGLLAMGITYGVLKGFSFLGATPGGV